MMNQMSNKKIGFSLIELMVVVAVIGILASIGVPAYSDYMTRGRIAEGLVILGKLKQMSIDYYNTNGSLPTLTQMGITSGAVYATNNISTVSVTISANESTISVTFTDTVGAGSGAKLSMVSSSANASTAGIITWTCSSTNIFKRYLPSPCTGI